MADQKTSEARRAKVLARKRQLHDRFLEKHGLRLTTAQKMLLPLKFLAFLFWWPIKIWLPDDPLHDERKEGPRGGRT